jgi:hypothetical protein
LRNRSKSLLKPRPPWQKAGIDRQRSLHLSLDTVRIKQLEDVGP